MNSVVVNNLDELKEIVKKQAIEVYSDINVDVLENLYLLHDSKKELIKLKNVDISKIEINNDFYQELNKTISELVRFKGEIKDWDTSNVTDMSDLFNDLKFKQDISKWNISGVVEMMDSLKSSEFKGQIKDWDLSSLEKPSVESKGNLKNLKISSPEKPSKAHFDYVVNRYVAEVLVEKLMENPSIKYALKHESKLDENNKKDLLLKPETLLDKPIDLVRVKISQLNERFRHKTTKDKKTLG